MIATQSSYTNYYYYTNHTDNYYDNNTNHCSILRMYNTELTVNVPHKTSFILTKIPPGIQVSF